MLRPESRGGHLGLTYSFVWIIVISNLITVGMIFLLLKQLVKVTQVRGTLLIPFILMLIYLGAFAEKNAFPDMVLVLIFGVFGWILEKLKWPRPPLILGLVLGGLAESRLFLSVSNYGLSWLWRPVVLVIMGLILFGALYPMYKARREKAKNRAGETFSPHAGNPEEPKKRVNKWSAIFAASIAIILTLALWQSRKFNVRAGLFPWVTGIPLLGLALLQLGKELTGKAGVRSRVKQSDEEHEIPHDVQNRRTRNMFIWIVVYFLAIWLLGFSIGGTLCCFLHLKFASKEKWGITIILTVGLWAFIYLLFQRVLHVPFPPGQIFEWFGLAG
jgi:hypothetical protein